MKVLVTGGTGYLGRAVVKVLLAARHDVVLYGRTASASGLPCPAVDGDVRDGERLLGAAAGCDEILHSAALVSVWRRRSRDFDDVNVGGLRSVLDAARRLAIRRVVYTSSFLALPPQGLDDPPRWNDYQRTKAAADSLADEAAKHGAPIVRLYPGVIYGPGVITDGNLVGRMVADHLQGRLPGLIGAERVWSFSYVEDVAAAHVAALDHGVPGPRYLLGGENAPQMRVFDIVRRLTGRARPRRIPDWLASPAALAYELGAAWFGLAPLLTTGTLEILMRDWPLEHTRASEDLGYRVTPLEEGVSRMVQAIQAPTAGA
jgi:NAD+-dependent farnesol dehydrogenase